MKKKKKRKIEKKSEIDNNLIRKPVYPEVWNYIDFKKWWKSLSKKEKRDYEKDINNIFNDEF